MWAGVKTAPLLKVGAPLPMAGGCCGGSGCC